MRVLPISGRFSLVSESPLIWAGVDFQEIELSSRTEALYDPVAGTLFVPEINIDQNLFDLVFSLTENCDATFCLEPQLDTLVDNGREGATVFTSALTASSTFSCASCHAILEVDGFAMDGLRRPGHALENAVNRETFKNGAIDNLLDAVNICVTEWMGGEPLASDDQDWINLQNWLQDQSTAEVAAPIIIDIVEPPIELSGGDEPNGRELFNERCIVCHGFDGEGTQLAPQITGRGLAEELIAARVRTSGLSDSAAYQGLTGGVMPFWGADRLSDGELIDIVAFVANSTEEEINEGMDDPVSEETGCTLTSAKIGQQAQLLTRFHDVQGTATIIDDCTIEITDFGFDGGGINTQIYVGTGGEFRETQGGFSVSGNLVGTLFLANTIRVTLPVGKTMDDFNSISVWCVPVSVSFGDGFFF
tara:strand:+ start:746 stop:2002 length:1257 start_codon:yes stop_codon:yes gene_type:complete